MLIGLLIPIVFAVLARTIKLPLFILSGFLLGAGLLFVVEKSKTSSFVKIVYHFIIKSYSEFVPLLTR
jgi:hypothetical protein